MRGASTTTTTDPLTTTIAREDISRLFERKRPRPRASASEKSSLNFSEQRKHSGARGELNGGVYVFINARLHTVAQCSVCVHTKLIVSGTESTRDEHRHQLVKVFNGKESLLLLPAAIAVIYKKRMHTARTRSLYTASLHFLLLLRLFLAAR